MLILRGAPALSTFRTQKLLASLQQQVPAVAGIATEYVHFADLVAPLNDEQQSILRQLLTYGPKVDGEVSHDGQLFLAPARCSAHDRRQGQMSQSFPAPARAVRWAVRPPRHTARRGGRRAGSVP